jgi:septum formation protein
MTLSHLILASGSPRRKELLRSFQLKLTVYPTDVDETFLWNKDNIEEGTVQLALGKAHAAKKAYPSSLILGADTVVVLHDEVLCKPKNREQAKFFLKNLSGHTHKVISGCAVLKGVEQSCLTETTYVTFNTLSEDNINSYLDTNLWTDKAGGYAIQGSFGSLLVKSIHGCYFNVLGLPLGKLIPILNDYGLTLWNALPKDPVA